MRLKLLAIPAFLLLLAGCEASSFKSPAEYGRFASDTHLAAGTASETPAAAHYFAPTTPPAPSDSTTVLADAVSPAEVRPALQRQIIYSASFNLTVPDIAHTQQAIRTTAESLGGYLQELSGDSITVRVPAAKFNDTVTAVEKMGEVTLRQIKAQDITEEMRDLAIRLDNSEKIRDRLTALIEKSQKMEDTLKIEAELERVTQTIELLKGKIQYLSQQLAYSALRVQLNSPLPQKQLVAQIPFQWVRDLGNGLVAGVAEPQPDTSTWFRRAARFDLPKSYVRYFERDEVTEAMSADGVLIKVQRQDNYHGGDADFWTRLCRRALVENRAVSITAEPASANAATRLLVGVKDVSGKPSGYLLGMYITDKHVYTFEAWGPQASFDRDLAALKDSFATLEKGAW